MKLSFYRAPDNTPQIEIQFEKDSVCLTQQQIVLLFGTQSRDGNKCIGAFFYLVFGQKQTPFKKEQ